MPATWRVLAAAGVALLFAVPAAAAQVRVATFAVHGGDSVPVERPHRDRGWIEVDDDGNAVVRVFGDVHVAAGERVRNDVVAVFGSVHIEGEVDGDVVAVFGSVRLGEGARVEGDVVSVGGGLEQAAGAFVDGETVSVGFAPVSWGIPGLPLTLVTIAMGWVAAVFTGWLFGLLFPDRFLRVAAVASKRTGAALALGLASLPGVLALEMLLFVTVIGIPLAFLLPLAYGLIAYAGHLAAAYLLGAKLTGRRPGPSGFVLPLAVGTLFVAFFFVLGAGLFAGPGVVRPFALFSVLLGCLLLLGLTAIGTGAFILSKLGAEPREVVWAAEASTPAPAPAPSPPHATA
jgi:hypothetical protein